MKTALNHCHPERGLFFAPKREEQPQSKDPYPTWSADIASGSSNEKLT
jgi:hypothetical protein